ncbi:MAG: protein-glutamate O-methyltransferase [Pseudomonadota bacterium]
MNSNIREFPFTRDDFNYLRKVANERTGIVVTDEKYDMFYSRLSRRVRKLGLSSFREYCDLIRGESDGQETLELVNAITTNLTSFFRENHHFEFLSRTLVPELLSSKGSEREIRIWSAGCSTGEEPYSIAMTLREVLPAGWKGSVLATDIDSNVLDKAASGVYALDRISNISDDRLRRWFQRGSGANDGMVKIKPEVRDLVRFERLNLMADWRVNGPLDMIFCRNVIIYFDKESKIRLIDRYADHIRNQGYLFIGHSESLFKISDRFELLHNTIYRKRG